jgi:hypothetical protein
MISVRAWARARVHFISLQGEIVIVIVRDMTSLEITLYSVRSAKLRWVLPPCLHAPRTAAVDDCWMHAYEICVITRWRFAKVSILICTQADSAPGAAHCHAAACMPPATPSPIHRHAAGRQPGSQMRPSRARAPVWLRLADAAIMAAGVCRALSTGAFSLAPSPAVYSFLESPKAAPALLLVTAYKVRRPCGCKGGGRGTLAGVWG